MLYGTGFDKKLKAYMNHPLSIFCEVFAYQMIDMKYQAVFSLKMIKKDSSASDLLVTLRVTK